MTDENKKEQIQILAERIKLLFGFCADLIPDLELLKETAESSSQRANDVLSMAPLIGAFGQDYESAHFNRRLEAKRAKALYELVKVLKETEDERINFKQQQSNKDEAMEVIRHLL